MTDTRNETRAVVPSDAPTGLRTDTPTDTRTDPQTDVLPDVLSPLSPDGVEGSVLDELHADLVDRAEVQGDLDVAYRTVDSPIGPLLLASTPLGLCRVAFSVEQHELVLQDLAARVSPRLLRAPHRLDHVARELDAFFAGVPTAFTSPVDLRLVGPFRGRVLEHLQTIAYGRTESYAQVARSIGSPLAVRAVGSACAGNPVPIVVPCHRVVRSDGSYGSYRGGAPAKRVLLMMEAAAPPVEGDLSGPRSAL